MFRKANPSNLRGSLLEGNMDHWTWRSKSFMSSPSTSASVNYNDKRSKDWCYRTHNTDLLSPDGSKFDHKKNCLRRLRNTQIRNMHEMGEIKRAQEQRIDEVSVQKLRENHETIQQLTSQLLQIQEQLNSMDDSGDFQDVESNFCGRLSHVSSQPAMIPSSRALLSRDKRLPLDTRNQSGLQENVFGNQLSTFDLPRDYSQRIQSDDVQKCRETVPEAGRIKTSHTSEDRQNQGTISVPTFAPRPLTTSFTIPVELLQNYMVGQQRQQISELQFDIFQNPPEKDTSSDFPSATQRQASIREKKGPSLGKTQVKYPHQRSPYAMKFEDRSREDTERQQRFARRQGLESR